MNPLSDDEKSHIARFQLTRPTWPLFVLDERIHDEDRKKQRDHKYERAHPYAVGMHYVLTHLKANAPLLVLDVGSPFMQNVAASMLPGIDLTVLDVRAHDDAESLGIKWKVGNATAIPFPDGTFDLVTCLWVMGHVGDGRYGDAFDVDGDIKMLAELARVLKPGGEAIVGPGLISAEPSCIFNLHRIYSWTWLESAFLGAGLELTFRRDIPVELDWFADGRVATRRDGAYALCHARKAAE